MFIRHRLDTYANELYPLRSNWGKRRSAKNDHVAS